jgi:hypothetical protein
MVLLYSLRIVVVGEVLLLEPIRYAKCLEVLVIRVAAVRDCGNADPDRINLPLTFPIDIP